MKSLSFIILFVLLAGCSARGTIYKDAALPLDSFGQVYVSREDSFWGSAADVRLLVNGELTAKLSNNGYTVLNLPEGNYRLSQDWSLSITSQDSNSIPIEVGNQQITYALVKMVSCASFERGELCHKPELTSIEKKEVIGVLSENRYQPVFNERELRYESCWYSWHPLFRYWC